MFNEPLPFSLVQIKLNKFDKTESYTRVFIFKFYRHNHRCCMKYIVLIKEYNSEYLTLDFYPKINLTTKRFSSDSLQDLRYRMLTRQNSIGYIGATLLKIMRKVQTYTGINIWGFLAASLPDETTNYNNKRFQLYNQILARTYNINYTVFGIKDKCVIIVIPNNQLAFKSSIGKNYEKIFSETN